MIAINLDRVVRNRAKNACEYCLMPQSARRLIFQIDHIIARQHRGPTVLENLALACGRCSRHKGTNLTAIDPVTGQPFRLFHPRLDRWPDHFRWEEALIIGVSEIGRATVDLPKMNHPDDIAVRRELIENGDFPPVI
jgi:hypothetical protein